MERCEGRIAGDSVEIPGTLCPRTGEPYKAYKSKQCTKKGGYSASIDHGDSNLPLCGVCFKRFESQSSSWNGFFDCSLPPEAKFVGSIWHTRMVEEGIRFPKQPTIKEKSETTQTIEELERWFKTMSLSEPSLQPGKLRELVKLRTQYNMEK
jgi:hypothetical protein